MKQNLSFVYRHLRKNGLTPDYLVVEIGHSVCHTNRAQLRIEGDGQTAKEA
jgi:hypothetical protein